ncbi:MAG: S41 family peptidase [Patescibacteria group bacterium]|jgi:carboxyl-terminal processing protease
MKNIFQKYFVVYIVVILVCLSFIGGLTVGRIEKGSEQGRVNNFLQDNKDNSYLVKNVNFQILDEIWKTIKSDYLYKDKVLDTQMFYGALRGVVDSLGDQHSMFFDPKEVKEFEDEMRGTFEGIGAELGIKNNQVVIVSPLADSPANKAGLKSGDKIMAVDGKMTASLALDEVVSMIRGPKGTKVSLLIIREGWDSPKEIEIIRDEIRIDSVRWSIKEGNIVYIEMYSFNDDTTKLFNKAINEILLKNPKGIILDLRNNPGGYFDGAVSVASEWIDEGNVVAKESFDGTKQNEYRAEGKSRLKGYPTVVLINGGSASGAEIVAGALQDYKIATLVGEKSFGKGSVQEFKNISDGSAIKLTIAKWLTPNNRDIDKEGIIPDIEVVPTEEDYKNNIDSQLQKAIEIIKSK